MATLKKHRTVAAPMASEVEEYRIEYDFAEDGGATGSLDVMTADGDLIIESVHTRVLTACTSTGSATLALGATGALAKFLTATQGAVANLTKDAVLFPLDASLADDTTWAAIFPSKLASGDKIIQAIATEAFTAGKVQYVVRVRKP